MIDVREIHFADDQMPKGSPKSITAECGTKLYQEGIWVIEEYNNKLIAWHSIKYLKTILFS